MTADWYRTVRSRYRDRTLSWVRYRIKNYRRGTAVAVEIF